jgi:hypothetical protein
MGDFSNEDNSPPMKTVVMVVIGGFLCIIGLMVISDGISMHVNGGFAGVPWAFMGGLIFLGGIGAFLLPRRWHKKKSQYICGYCNYISNSETELHNHSLNCEAYKEENKSAIDVLMDANRETKKEKSPIDILKERYAKGEITREEFEQMKKDLSLGI